MSNDWIQANNGNDRYQCHKCAKWRRFWKIDKDGRCDYTIFGGDSDCGCICKFCIKKYFPDSTGENPAICEKCAKKMSSSHQ